MSITDRTSLEKEIIGSISASVSKIARFLFVDVVSSVPKKIPWIENIISCPIKTPHMQICASVWHHAMTNDSIVDIVSSTATDLWWYSNTYTRRCYFPIKKKNIDSCIFRLYVFIPGNRLIKTEYIQSLQTNIINHLTKKKIKVQ